MNILAFAYRYRGCIARQIAFFVVAALVLELLPFSLPVWVQVMAQWADEAVGLLVVIREVLK